MDWLHALLNSTQRQDLVDGLDARGIQPFWRSVDNNRPYLDNMNNLAKPVLY